MTVEEPSKIPIYHKAPSPHHPPTIPHHHRRNVMIGIAVAVLIALILYFCYWLFFSRFYVTTEDAYTGGNIITITARVSGTPIAIYTDNAQLVKEGQLLAELDPTDYQIAYEKALSSLRLTIRDVLKLREDVAGQRADLVAQKTKLTQATYDLENRKKGVAVRAIANEVYEHGQNNVTLAKTALAISKHRYIAAKAALGNQKIQDHPMIQKAKETVIEAYINLQRCRILAPATGYVAKRHIEIGTSISKETPLMAIVPLNKLWVEANFRETELRDMRIGQPVTIVTDLYGNKATLHSKVAGISPGTGRLFSLLPPENASGNWIKVVQRVPVRIYLDQSQLKDFPLLAGISSTVSVDITDRSGSFLVPLPNETEIMSTSIYHLPLVEVQNTICRVMKEEGIGSL